MTSWEPEGLRTTVLPLLCEATALCTAPLMTEIKIAARVAKVVFDSNLACVAEPGNCEAFIRDHVYKPEYRDFAS